MTTFEGYLAWRPQTGTTLGLHQYDGRLTDYSQASLDSELARLKFFDKDLADFDTNRLSTHAFYDYRILLQRHPARDFWVSSKCKSIPKIP